MFSATFRVFKAVLFAFVLVAAVPPAARAQEPVLLVSGPSGQPLQITLDDLRKLPAKEIRTSTPWTDGPQTFRGISGAQLARLANLSGREVSAEAINQYRVLIPWEVFTSESLMIAYARNGQPMGVREKGPLWIVFPFDSDPRFMTDIFKSYAIWSLSRLDVR